MASTEPFCRFGGSADERKDSGTGGDRKSWAVAELSKRRGRKYRRQQDAKRPLIIPALTLFCLVAAAPEFTAPSIAGASPDLPDRGRRQSHLRCEFSSLEQCREISGSGRLGYCIKNPAVAAMPWPAPVGHNQPRASDSANRMRFSGHDPGDDWLDQTLDGKL